MGQWFGILQRKRLRISDFTNLEQLAERLLAFVQNGTLMRIPSIGPLSLLPKAWLHVKLALKRPLRLEPDSFQLNSVVSP